MDFIPKTEDDPSARNRVGFGLDKCLTKKELPCTSVIRPVVKKGFLMLRSMSSGPFWVALLIAIANASFAHAQASRQVHPFFLTQGAGKKSVVGYTPSQIRRAYGFDQIKGQGSGQT